MADTPAPASSWSLGHVAAIIGGAAVGAAVLPFAVPAVIGVAGLGAAASALGISVSAGVGSLVGGYIGHKAAAPA